MSQCLSKNIQLALYASQEGTWYMMECCQSTLRFQGAKLDTFSMSKCG